MVAAADEVALAASVSELLVAVAASWDASSGSRPAATAAAKAVCEAGGALPVEDGAEAFKLVPPT